MVKNWFTEWAVFSWRTMLWAFTCWMLYDCCNFVIRNCLRNMVLVNVICVLLHSPLQLSTFFSLCFLFGSPWDIVVTGYGFTWFLLRNWTCNDNCWFYSQHINQIIFFSFKQPLFVKWDPFLFHGLLSRHGMHIA